MKNLKIPFLPYRLPRTLCALGLLGAAGCVGTETGNPPLDVEYQAVSSNDGVALRSGENATVVEQAWLSLGDAQLLGCEGADPFVIEGLGTGDHAAVEHATQEVAPPAGDYCGVSLSFAPSPATSDAPEILTGQGGTLAGQTAAGEPFALAFDADPVVTISFDAPLEVSDPTTPILVAFDVGEWLRNIDLGSLEEVDGVRTGGASSAEGLALKTAIPSGISIVLDQNANGAIDEGEAVLGRGE